MKWDVGYTINSDEGNFIRSLKQFSGEIGVRLNEKDKISLLKNTAWRESSHAGRYPCPTVRCGGDLVGSGSNPDTVNNLLGGETQPWQA